MILFVISEALQGLRRNSVIFISLVLVTFISLTFIGASGMLQMQIHNLKEYWNSKAQISIDFCSPLSEAPKCGGRGATNAEQDAVSAVLSGPILKQYVNNFYFETPQDRYNNFIKAFSDNPVSAFVKPEQFGGTFWVQPKDPKNANVILQVVSVLSGVESVSDNRKFLEFIFTSLGTISLVSFIIALIILFAAVLILSTTTRLSIHSRRRELEIMRLVGASNALIRTPFILEGVLAGVIGSVAATGTVLLLTHFVITQYLSTTVPLIPYVSLWPNGVIIGIILLTVGCVTCSVASTVSVKRYLRE